LIIVMMTRRVYCRPQSALLQALWVRALCIASCQICFIYSLNHLSLVESVVLFGTGPLFLPLLEKLIFSVELEWVSILGLVVTFLGVFLLAGDKSRVNVRFELLVGLASGLFNAGSQLSLFRISKSGLGALEINYWTFLFAAILLVPVASFQFISVEHVVIPQSDEFMLLLVVILCLSALIINTQVFRSKAYRLVDSSTHLAPLIFTNLLFSALWQWLFYQESYQYSQIVGLMLIVCANMFTVFTPMWLAREKPSAV
ncbi:DMT family transporter, partial [Vibrio sp. M260118]|uniref:DMT family transporter n=1 Tax=Vibrio sp. M260118 TaxID=3020896 RepID=UPI002F42C14D